MTFHIHGQEPTGDELAKHPSPLSSVQICADAERALPIVAETLYSLGILTLKHIDEIVDAETLPGSVRRRQRHLRGLRCVPGLHGFQAGIAVSAWTVQVITEVGEQRLAPAGGDFAQPQQGVEPMLLRHPPLG